MEGASSLCFELAVSVTQYLDAKFNIATMFFDRYLGRVVKALDLRSNGHSPRGFKPHR